jgi:hypothetical protein
MLGDDGDSVAEIRASAVNTATKQLRRFQLP